MNFPTEFDYVAMVTTTSVRMPVGSAVCRVGHSPRTKFCHKVNALTFKVKNCVVSIEKGGWYGFGPRARKVL